MSRRLLVMLILIIIRLKSKSMASVSSLHHIQDCFYEKHGATSLNGHNDFSNEWISELDCLDRCLKMTNEDCRSFEHWFLRKNGLCVRSNVSLSDQPSERRTNTFVNYYEIDCRKDVKAIRTEIITCPGDELILLVSLNGIDPNYVLLGDESCKPKWSNETHVQFKTHVDNCSLMITDGSIVGKLRWEGVVKDTDEAKHYERFFLCPSDIYQMRTAQLTTRSSIKNTTPIINAQHGSKNSNDPSISEHFSSVDSSSSFHENNVTVGISLRWFFHDRTYVCPEICSLSLLSSIHVLIETRGVSISPSLIESCDFRARHPFTNYFQTRRLISRGCSLDPQIIHLPSNVDSTSMSLFSFQLYNIVKEPIPFEIQCKIYVSHSPVTNCSSWMPTDVDSMFHRRKDSTEYPTKIYRSSPVEVIRHLSSKFNESIHFSNSATLMITVHRFQCLTLILLFIVFLFS